MKGTVEQGLANHLKRFRAFVRTEYSIMADNELNKRKDEIVKRFYKSVQQGQLPEAIDLRKVYDDVFDV